MGKRKYEGATNLFTYRRDRDTWKKFVWIAHVKVTTPTRIFDEIIDQYIEDNTDILDKYPVPSAINEGSE